MTAHGEYRTLLAANFGAGYTPADIAAGAGCGMSEEQQVDAAPVAEAAFSINMVSAALAGIALGCFVAACFFRAPQMIVLVVIGNLLVLIACGLFVYPLLRVLFPQLRALRQQHTAVNEQLDSVLELRELFELAPDLVKENRRARVATEALREGVLAERGQVETATRELREGLFRMRALEEELQQARLAQASSDRLLESWVESSVDYFEYLQRLIKQLTPEDPRLPLLRQITAIFARFTAAHGLNRIFPSPGEPMVSGLYQVIGEEERRDLPSGMISRCESWGYRLGNQVIRQAEVYIVRHSEHEGDTQTLK